MLADPFPGGAPCDGYNYGSFGRCQRPRSLVSTPSGLLSAPWAQARATCPEASSTGLTTYDSPAENGSGSTGSTDGLVDSVGPGDLSYNYQGECAMPWRAV